MPTALAIAAGSSRPTRTPQQKCQRDTRYNILQHKILYAKTCTSFQNDGDDGGVQLPSMLPRTPSEQTCYTFGGAHGSRSLRADIRADDVLIIDTFSITLRLNACVRAQVEAGVNLHPFKLRENVLPCTPVRALCSIDQRRCSNNAMRWRHAGVPDVHVLTCTTFRTRAAMNMIVVVCISAPAYLVLIYYTQ